MDYGATDSDGDAESEYELYEPIADVSWTYITRIYLLVPLVTLLSFTSLVLLSVFAWPPSAKERQHGQTYPHPFLPWPFLTGVFASCTIQSLRVPTWVLVSNFPGQPALITALSTTIHTILHELARMATLPMIAPSPTSGFHSSYYLGLGWGIAEAAWGIVQGWEQLTLYEDVLVPPLEEVRDEVDEMDEAELERKVEALERMRARRDLEEVLGTPFPNIPIALHMLWRIDTLLLNLGLTLVLSSYYFNSYPIYHVHAATPRPSEPSRWLWLVWALVVLLHVGVSLVWRIVGRVGIGAVTWGGLIVALGTVFAGLGGWGGLL